MDPLKMPQSIVGQVLRPMCADHQPVADLVDGLVEIGCPNCGFLARMSVETFRELEEMDRSDRATTEAFLDILKGPPPKVPAVPDWTSEWIPSPPPDRRLPGVTVNGVVSITHMDKACRLTSYNPADIENKYCGNCHRFLAEGEYRINQHPQGKGAK